MTKEEISEPRLRAPFACGYCGRSYMLPRPRACCSRGREWDIKIIAVQQGGHVTDTNPTSNPRRFVLTRDPIRPLGVAMEHAKTGPWVPWEDYEVLIRERDEARDEAERMRRTRDEEIRRLRDDARDAARYRYLRERLACDRLAARKLVITTEGGREPYRTLREAELDREIDECIGLSVEPKSVHPGSLCSCVECQNRFPSSTPREAYMRMAPEKATERRCDVCQVVNVHEFLNCANCGHDLQPLNGSEEQT